MEENRMIRRTLIPVTRKEFLNTFKKSSLWKAVM